MPSNSLTGRDSVIVDGRLLEDLVDGDNAALTFPNEVATVKTGKNGNTLFASNATGRQGDLTLRVIRGSSSDRFLHRRYKDQQRDLSLFVLLTARLIKRIGDGTGGITNDTYNLTGGVFIKNQEGKSNAEGDTEQSVTIYQLRFGNVERAIL
jgi:hypothetical protein